MKMPNMFRKVVGAVATAAVMAGAPGAANAGMERVPMKSEISNLSNFCSLNESNLNKKLEALKLSKIKLEVWSTIEDKEKKIANFTVSSEKDSSLLMHSECNYSDFQNKYIFEEKVFKTIVDKLNNKN